VEAKYLALQNNKKNRRKKKRKKRLLILLAACVLAALYFISDFSKVKSLDVRGNSFYTKQMVLQKVGLTYDSRYIVIPRFYLEWKLEKD
ncbi:cell division protein FtsQ, partial [Erysipelatoclostridium ramosum]|nr:cell division protein FtsQ [Thomasclavelia ramosa]